MKGPILGHTLFLRRPEPLVPRLRFVEGELPRFSLPPRLRAT